MYILFGIFLIIPWKFTDINLIKKDWPYLANEPELRYFFLVAKYRYVLVLVHLRF